MKKKKSFMEYFRTFYFCLIMFTCPLAMLISSIVTWQLIMRHNVVTATQLTFYILMWPVEYVIIGLILGLIMLPGVLIIERLIDE